MGVMTLQNFQDDLKSALGRASEDANRMTRWINNAIREFAYAFEFSELQATGSITTVNGTPSYAMPNDFRAFSGEVNIRTPQDRFGGKLSPETRQMYLRTQRYAQTSSYGRPSTYHTYGNKIWLRATPDATAMTVEFDYWRSITALSAANDVSEFSDDWDDVIFRGALYRGYMAHGEHDRMVNAFNMYLALVRSRVDAGDMEELPEGGISYIQSQFDAERR